jgi:hypothetical protein
VAVISSEESRLDALADPGNFGDMDENNPRSIARWMKKMGQETGEDMGGEFDEMIGRVEAGETLEDIETSMSDDSGSEGLDDD